MKKTVICGMVLVSLILSACGPSAEEQAKESARIEEEIRRIKEEIKDVAQFREGLEVKAMKETIARKNEKIEKGPAPFVKYSEEEKREVRKEVKELEAKLEEAKKKQAEAGPKYDALIKKLKDEYGIEYQP